MTYVARLQDQPWLEAPETIELMETLEQSGITARFVGGCVRDGVLGKPVFDIDIAVDLPPEDVFQKLSTKGIKCVPTGIDHGTITAVLHQKPYQITTLRSDVRTDGRHAEVDFIRDWTVDAGRRDFTINALYADKDGYIYDPLETGLPDLKAGKVCFIGNPYDRIEEDALRILRFFRFSAHYSPHTIDPLGLKACISFADKLNTLSAERIFHEFWRLCSAYTLTPILKDMQAAGILKILFPFGGDFQKGIATVSTLHDIEEAVNLESSPFLKMLALLLDGTPKELPKRLKFSKKDRDYFGQITDLVTQSTEDPSPFFVNKCLYRYGPYLTQDYLLLKATLQHQNTSQELQDICHWLRPLLERAQDWQRPLFPFRGEDIVREGIAPGPEVSRYFKAVQDWWMTEDFKPTHGQCLDYFRRIRNNS